ncbi:hypothetical protein ACIG0A_12905 [Streptomyces californicus]|uniref:hypothetical protein n=1 Tax=Streptomyces californicus TaxID=67351 RepID=UPI0037CFC101
MTAVLGAPLDTDGARGSRQGDACWVLRDPGGEPFGAQGDVFDALAHAASAPVEVPAEPKIFPRASASSSSLKCPCSSS